MKRYVDDTYTYVKNDSVCQVLDQLNAFDPKIQFTYELAGDNTLTFLDTKIKWQHGHFETSVYRKDTNTDLYIHWESPAPHTWKRSTLGGLVYIYTVCSEKHLLDQELEHLKTTFAEINGYPTKVIKRFLDNLRCKLPHKIQKQYNHLTTFKMKRYCE